MNYGRQASLREGPCKEGHTWHPVGPTPGRPGFVQHHCPVCGEWASMAVTGEPDPIEAIDKRIADLEAQVARLLQLLPDGAD